MNDISITRGDTLNLEIKLTDQNGDDYVLQEGDELVFTLKKDVYTQEILLQKNISRNRLTITHIETQTMKYGKYVYDVQLTQSNGDVTTVIKPSKFIITEEVNFD